MALLPKDPKKQKQIVIGLIPIVLLVAYYQFMYSPRVLAIGELDSRLTNLTSQNDIRKATILRFGNNLAGRIAIFEEHIRKLEELIPKREDVPTVISQVTEQAGLSEVDIVEFNPAGETPGDFYGLQSFGLEIIGDYHSVGEYLASIGSLSRIVRPAGLSLKLEPARPASRLGPMLRAAFRIETFIMPDPAEVKAKADSAAAVAAAAAAAAAPPPPVTTGGEPLLNDDAPAIPQAPPADNAG